MVLKKKDEAAKLEGASVLICCSAASSGGTENPRTAKFLQWVRRDGVWSRRSGTQLETGQGKLELPSLCMASLGLVYFFL